MNATSTSKFRIVKRIQAETFDLKKIPSYSLCLQVGTRDFQICVVNKQTGTCLLFEDYKLENIKTVNARLHAIMGILDEHPLVSSKLWDSVKLCFKTHKFTLVPLSHFLPEAASDYLVLNSEIKTQIEEVYYYKHISTNAVNVFSCDKKIVSWVKRRYPNKSIQIVHQGSALAEGILQYDDHGLDRMMFAYFDRGIIHVFVTKRKKLLYYNQFAVRKSDDYLKYIMLVFKELRLAPKTTSVIIWGLIKNDAPQIELLKKYIRNISLGTLPNFLKFPEAFNETADHRYFDTFSLFLCE